MEIYVHDRTEEETVALKRKKYIQQYGKEPDQRTIESFRKEAVKENLVNPYVFDKFNCEPDDFCSTQPLDIKIYGRKYINNEIKKNIKEKVNSYLKNVKSVENPKFIAVHDMIDVGFNDDNTILNYLKSKGLIDNNFVIINRNEITKEYYEYTKYKDVINLYWPVRNLKEKFVGNSLNDLKDFEGDILGKIDYLSKNKTEPKTENEKLIKTFYDIRQVINRIAKHFMYCLIHECIKNKYNILYFDFDRNPYNINCILTKHFKTQLTDYKVQYYIPIMNQQDFINKKLNLFKQTGQHTYSGVLEKYDLFTQNMIIYTTLYFKDIAEIILFSFNNGPLNKYLNLASFVSQYLQFDKNKLEMDFKYDYQAETIEENEEKFRNSKNYQEINNELNEFVNNIKNKYQHLAGGEKLFKIIFGTPGVGKTRIVKDKKYLNVNDDNPNNKLAFISRDDAYKIPMQKKELDNLGNKVDNIIKLLGNNYNEKLVKVLRDSIYYVEQTKIFLRYWQYGLIAYYRCIEWAAENNISIITDIGGGDNPFKFFLYNIPKLKDYKFQIYVIHARLSEHFAAQLARTLIEKRFVGKESLNERNNRNYKYILNFLKTEPKIKDIDMFILDNTNFSYDKIYTKVNGVEKFDCEIKRIDSEETEFLKLWEYLCSKTGKGESNVNIVIIAILCLVIILILFNIFLKDSVNLFKFRSRSCNKS